MLMLSRRRTEGFRARIRLETLMSIKFVMSKAEHSTGFFTATKILASSCLFNSFVRSHLDIAGCKDLCYFKRGRDLIKMMNHQLFEARKTKPFGRLVLVFFCLFKNGAAFCPRENLSTESHLSLFFVEDIMATERSHRGKDIVACSIT